MSKSLVQVQQASVRDIAQEAILGEGWEQEDDVTLLTLQRTAASLI